jgi:hypothetical protein
MNELVMWPGVGQPTVPLTFTMSTISLTRFPMEEFASERSA